MIPYRTHLQAFKWILAAIRPWFFKEAACRGHEFPLDNALDWRTISDLAYVHNVEPLLYHQISRGGLRAEIPTQLIQRWERTYFENVIRNEEHLEFLKRFLERCAEKKRHVIVLKGPALIGRIYKDPGTSHHVGSGHPLLP